MNRGCPFSIPGRCIFAGGERGGVRFGGMKLMTTRIPLQRHGEGGVGCRNARRTSQITSTPRPHRPSCRRYGRPLAARWPNRDPLGEPGFETSRRRRASLRGDGPNLYHFVRNNPVGGIDKLGLAYGNPVSGPNGPVAPGLPWYCPSKCGPDYTAAVNAEIAAFRTFINSFPNEEINSWVDVINTTIWFGLVAGTLNYDAQAKEASKGQHPFSGCPSFDCFGTITLCGKCVTSDVPGNIMFGFMREALIGNFLANTGAIIIEMLDFDGEFFEQDLNVFPLGNELYLSGSDDICSVLGKLPGHATSKCQPCSQTGSFGRPFPFRKYPPPTTLHP